MEKKSSLGSLKRKRMIRVYGWKITTLTLLVLLILSIYTDSSSLRFSSKKISKEEAVAKVNEFLKLDESADFKAVVDDIIELDDVYEFKISITVRDFTQKTTAHMTKDGKLFFPQSVNLDEMTRLIEELKETPEEPKGETNIIIGDSEETDSEIKAENVSLTLVENKTE